MFKSLVKSAFRNITNKFGYSFLNILGMTLGITSALFLILYVSDELSFDKYHENLHLILTGSARLDVFQKSGDSLFGRYYLYHLHPLTCGELSLPDKLPKIGNIFNFHSPISAIDDLLKFSGFPEPFCKQSVREHRRWSNARKNLLIREDLRELTQVKLITLVEQLMLLLPERIGSLFSYRSLSEDLRVAPTTVQNWMDIFQKLFIVYSISPYTKKIIRSIQKQPKFYLYDWSCRSLG